MVDVIVFTFDGEKIDLTTETPMVLALRDLLYEADWELMLRDLGSTTKIKEEVEKLRKLEDFLDTTLSFSSLGPFLINEFKSFVEEHVNLSRLSHVSLNGLYDEALNYADLKLYDQVELTLRFMLEIDPNYAPAYELWGSISMEKGDTEKGVEMLKKALEIDPYLVSAYTMLGDHFYNLGKYEEAARYWEKEIEIAPSHKFTYFMIADAYKKTGDLQKAIEILEKFLEIDDRSLLAMYDIAELYREKGDLQKAESYKRKIMSSLPHYNSDVEIWAKLMFQNGKYEEVRRFIESGISNGYLDRDFEFLLVVPYLKSGEVEKARELVNRYGDCDSWIHYGRQKLILEVLTEEERALCGL